MKQWFLALVCVGMLAGCGGSKYSEPGGGNPPPDPTPNPTFVVTYDTPPASFKVDKGGSTTINATVDIKWGMIKKVRFSTHANYTGLEVSPSTATITPGSPLQITVSTTPLLSFCSPSFTIDAVGLNAQNQAQGPQPATTTYRWAAGNCP